MNTLWKPAGELNTATGLVFGEQGEDYLSVAIEEASADGSRKVGVLAAANVGALRGKDIVGYVEVPDHATVEKFVAETKPDEIDAIVFYGLGEYAQAVLTGICGERTPTQAEWGEMARIVSNDIRSLTTKFNVVYATLDVITETKKSDGKDVTSQRLNLNPGTQKLILGFLADKLFVSTRRTPDGYETVVQRNAAMALKFQPPPREARTGAAGNRPTGRR